ncbi:urease accessory protein UreD [Paenibacillus sp. J5C_2022]|uniref:urease accessory protein UreD n=1 Tax=Paenibacillus sp. J5C2022 TaxID=2977129 RepID=UPI0021D02E3A|nr:urease accessory protein UreD [Paenibacillus sp. J5C2022]MCU6707410.1 urease accessory protein UreD [Paenibacillus sp. J5C2022]
MDIAYPDTFPSKRAVLRALCSSQVGKTELTACYATAPLKVAKPFREAATSGLILYVMDVSPGLLEGDHYDIAVTLERDARLVLTNQSFTKVHPSGQLTSIIEQRFTIGPDAVLEFMPEPAIPYANSRFESVTSFHLAKGAVLMFGDIWTPGRTRRGERFAFHSVSNRLEIYRGESLIGWDHFRLEPGRDVGGSLGAMEHYTHQASFWLFHEGAGLEAMLDRIRLLLPAGDELLAGASLHAHGGLVVRMLGMNVWQLQLLLNRIWAECRSSLWGLPPCSLRK